MFLFRYESAQQGSLQRHKRITNALLYGQKLHDEVDALGTWLAGKDELMSDRSVLPCSESGITLQTKEVKEWLSEVDERKPVLENIAVVLSSLTQYAETDQSACEEEVSLLQGR